MAQQIINLGATPNDGTGDTIRIGGDKINDNFTEVYASTSTLTSRTDSANNTSTIALTNAALNSAYPTAALGFTVYALSIIAGALIYRKTSTGWISIPVTIVL